MIDIREMITCLLTIQLWFEVDGLQCQLPTLQGEKNFKPQWQVSDMKIGHSGVVYYFLGHLVFQV